MGNIRLINGNLVIGEKVEKRDCLLKGGRIILSDKGAAEETCIDLSGKYILPGFIDIHFHGYYLFDFTLGSYSQQTNSYETSDEAFAAGYERLTKGLVRFGLTGCYAATLATSIENLRIAYSNMRKFVQKQTQAASPNGTRIFGGSLEGSFISRDMAGAQNPKYVFDPEPENFDAIDDKGTIKLALVAPDCGEKAIKLTEYLSSKGIIVGTGHTNATGNNVEKAIAKGLKYAIHFTNGPTGGSYKPFNGGGTIETVLRHDDVYAEQILDGFHVNPAYVRDIIKRKSVDKIIGVTDCGFMGGSDIKQFEMAGVKGEVSPDGNFVRVLGKPNTLFGSNLSMNRAFRNILNWLSIDMEGIWNKKHEAMSFEAAIVTAAKICSTNACKLTGLVDDGFGQIADNARADLCVLDITGSEGNYCVNVEMTIVDGKVVYSKN